MAQNIPDDYFSNKDLVNKLSDEAITSEKEKAMNHYVNGKFVPKRKGRKPKKELIGSAWQVCHNPNLNDLPTIEQVRLLLYDIPLDRDQAMCISLYLTSCRIGEIIGMKLSDIQLVKVHDRLCLKFITPLEKNTNERSKKVYYPLDCEPKLCEILWNYVKSIKQAYQNAVGLVPASEARLFPLENRQRAYEIVRRSTGFNPHLWRHVSLTHMHKRFGFTEVELMKQAGWGTTGMASRYVKVSSEDLVEKMKP